MKMNAGARIGLIGGLAGILIAIIAVLTTAGPAGIYISIAILVMFGGMFFLFYKLFFESMINAARLQKIGTPGKALITEVKDTGVTINQHPQVKLTLEVKNSLGQRYTTTTKTLVSRINPFLFQPGVEVPVMIDPKNEMNVVVDLSYPKSITMQGHVPQHNEAALKSELEQLQKDNDSIALSGRGARAIIKKYNWLGAYVNGQNPYVELDLEILPEHAAAFPGKAKAVIAASSVSKYQPGNEIHIKYDLYDNSKVVIDHA